MYALLVYRCSFRCRNYTYIPTNCQLTKPSPNECCEELVCRNALLDPSPGKMSNVATTVDPVTPELKPPHGLLLTQQRFRERSGGEQPLSEYSLMANRLSKDPTYALELAGISPPERSYFATDSQTAVRRTRIGQPNASNNGRQRENPSRRPTRFNSHVPSVSSTSSFRQIPAYLSEDTRISMSRALGGIPVYVGSMKRNQQNTKDSLGQGNASYQLTREEEIVIALEHEIKPDYTSNTARPNQDKNKILVNRARIPGTMTYSVVRNKRTRPVQLPSNTFPSFSAPGVEPLPTLVDTSASNTLPFELDVTHFSRPGAYNVATQDASMQDLALQDTGIQQVINLQDVSFQTGHMQDMLMQDMSLQEIPMYDAPLQTSGPGIYLILFSDKTNNVVNVS